MRGGEKTIPFTYVKFESKSFTNNMGHHKETNRKKKKAFQTTGGEKTGLMTGDSITTFDIQPLSDTSKKTNCFAKTGIKNICYRAEDVTPPDSSKYDEWKADWNPPHDGPYFIEVNKKSISQANVKKPPWVLPSVPLTLPKVDL